MDSETAREFTEAVDQAGSGIGQAATGWWRQIAVGVRLNVPKALGLPRAEWAQERRAVIGNMQLPEAERKQAVVELTSPVEEHGDGLNNSQAADVLGVHEATVRRDLSANAEMQVHERGSQGEADADDSANAEQRIAQLDADLAERVRGGLSIDEAESVTAERRRRIAAYVKKVRDALEVLSRMKGSPIPAELDGELSDQERSVLAAVLGAIPEGSTNGSG